MEIFRDIEIWVLIGFLIFVGLLGRTGWKLMTSALDGRAAEVRSELDEAKRLRAEAQAVLDDYRAKQAAAVKNAADILSAAKDEAEQMRRDGEAELKRSLTVREAQAMDRISQAEQAAVAAVKAKAVDLAIRAATGIIPDVVDKAGAKALVDQAIDQLPAA